MISESGPGRGSSQRSEMAPRRYNRLAALAVTERVALEFEMDTVDDAFRSAFINAITPALEQSFLQVEPIERKRVAALRNIDKNLRDRPLTAAEYQTAGITLRELVGTGEELQQLDLKEAYRYINDCAEDAEYYEKQVAPREEATPASQTRQVSAVVRDRSEERARAGIRRRNRRQLAATNTKLVVVNVVAAASTLGFLGGLLGDQAATKDMSHLPGYASSDTRYTVVRDLNDAIRDLTAPGASTPQTEKALKSLRDAGNDLKGAGTVITRPITTVEGDIAGASTDPAQSGDVFTADRDELRKEIRAVRGLANTPDAKQFEQDEIIAVVSDFALYGSLAIGAVDGGAGENLRRKRKRLRQAIRDSY